MAEDKRIRVSADASPLQELRQNAQALWNDFNKMESEFKNIAEQTVGVIQKQIDLLKERNALAGGMQGYIIGSVINCFEQCILNLFPGAIRKLSITFHIFRGEYRTKGTWQFIFYDRIFAVLINDFLFIGDIRIQHNVIAISKQTVGQRSTAIGVYFHPVGRIS